MEVLLIHQVQEAHLVQGALLARLSITLTCQEEVQSMMEVNKLQAQIQSAAACVTRNQVCEM